MCLITKKRTYVTTRERTFYKVAIYEWDAEDHDLHIYTPFKKNRLVLGKLYKEPTKGFEFHDNHSDNVAITTETSVKLTDEHKAVYGGGHHLFTRKKDAEDFAVKMDKNAKVLRAIVPAGTKYVVGKFFAWKSTPLMGLWCVHYPSVCVKSVKYETIDVPNKKRQNR